VDHALRRALRAPADPVAAVRRATELRRSLDLPGAVAALRPWASAAEAARDALLDLAPSWPPSVGSSSPPPAPALDGLRPSWVLPTAAIGAPLLVATELVVVAGAGGDELLAVDRGTGRPRWELEGWVRAAWLHPRARPPALLTVVHGAGRTEVVARSLETGAELGHTVLGLHHRLCGPCDDGDLLLTDLPRRKLLRVREERPGVLGRVRWTRPLGRRSVAPIRAGSRLLVARGRAVECLNAADGSARWRRPTAGTLEGGLGDADGFVLPSPPDGLRALDADGAERWRVAVGGPGVVRALSRRHVLVASGPARGDDHTYRLLDRQSGAPLARVDLRGHLVDAGLWADAAVLVTRLAPPYALDDDDLADGADPLPRHAPVWRLGPTGAEALDLPVPGGAPLRLAPLCSGLVALTDGALCALERPATP